MNKSVNLKKIEKKAWTSYFQDGLLDIFLGLVLLNLGMAPFIEDLTGIAYLLSYIAILAAAFVIFYCGKIYITIPRLGRANFRVERISRSRKTAIVLVLSVLLGLVIWVLAATGSFPFFSSVQFAAIAFGINAIIVFSVMAYLLDFNRLYLYGWLFAVSIVVVELSRSYVGSIYDNVVGFGIFGMIIIFIGAAYLTRFINKYPLPTEEMSLGS